MQRQRLHAQSQSKNPSASATSEQCSSRVSSLLQRLLFPVVRTSWQCSLHLILARVDGDTSSASARTTEFNLSCTSPLSSSEFGGDLDDFGTRNNFLVSLEYSNFGAEISIPFLPSPLFFRKPSSPPIYILFIWRGRR